MSSKPEIPPPPPPPTTLETGLPSPKPPRDIHGLKWLSVLLSLLASTFLYALDNTIVADVQPDIIRTFSSSSPFSSSEAITKLPWLGLAFVWGNMSTILLWNKLYSYSYHDHDGIVANPKWLYIAACVVFEVGSAVCGSAASMDGMIVGRAIAGLGSSGMYLGCLSYISSLTSDAERPTYMGYTGISWGSGLILGPVVGGAFAQNASATWRWAFWINLVLFGVFGPVFVFMLPKMHGGKTKNITKNDDGGDRKKKEEEEEEEEDEKQGGGILDAIRNVDWLGVVLELGGSLAGIMAVSFGGVVYPWGSGRIIALFVVAGVVLGAFLLQQHFAFGTTKAQRILPLGLFRSKSVVLIWLLIVFPSCAVLVPIYYIPLLFRFAHGDSPIEAAVRLLPIILTFVFFAVAGGAFVSRTGWFYPWFLGGSLLIVIGSSLMYADVHLDSPVGKTYGYSALIGIGSGAIGQLSYSIAQFKIDPRMMGDAVGLICMGQYLGITLGLTISGAVFQNQAFARVAEALPPGTTEDVISAAVQGLEGTLGSFDEDIKRQVSEAIAGAIQNTYPLVIVAGGLAFVSALLLGNERFSMKKPGS